jgi:hypothetical protein
MGECLTTSTILVLALTVEDVTYSAYQCECGDYRLHERHWVSVHWRRHGWADTSGVERVPRMTTLAEPFVFLAWRPLAEPAPDAMSRWFAVAFKLVIRHRRSSDSFSGHIS